MANAHAEVIDTLDEASSTATISLKGLGLFCFNEQGAFEGAFVRRPTHTYMIEIKESGTAGSSPRLRITGFEGDVDIQVLQPAREGSRRYQQGVFNRRALTGNDPRDFRWVVDLEGPEVHDKSLGRSDRAPQQQAESQLRRLRISAGTFYTKAQSQDTYALVRTDNESVPAAFFGAVSEDLGAEIECADGAGLSGLLVTMRDRKLTQEILLPKLPEVKYEITFNNDCPPVPVVRPESDFRIFYDVVSDSTGRQFDLANAVDPGDPRAEGGVPLDDAPVPKFRDRYGLVCNKVYLGLSSSLSHLS